jgi:phenylalanyl-tRNA synthetase alpha subunit
MSSHTDSLQRFAEMPTSQFVESGFWNFDSLFVPQQHPARDLQDTFYISDPAVSKPPPKDYYDRVSTVHTVSRVAEWRPILMVSIGRRL